MSVYPLYLVMLLSGNIPISMQAPMFNPFWSIDNTPPTGPPNVQQPYNNQAAHVSHTTRLPSRLYGDFNFGDAVNREYSHPSAQVHDQTMLTYSGSHISDLYYGYPQPHIGLPAWSTHLVNTDTAPVHYQHAVFPTAHSAVDHTSSSSPHNHNRGKMTTFSEQLSNFHPVPVGEMVLGVNTDEPYFHKKLEKVVRRLPLRDVVKSKLDIVFYFGKEYYQDLFTNHRQLKTIDWNDKEAAAEALTKIREEETNPQCMGSLSTILTHYMNKNPKVSPETRLYIKKHWRANRKRVSNQKSTESARKKRDAEAEEKQERKEELYQAYSKKWNFLTKQQQQEKDDEVPIGRVVAGHQSVVVVEGGSSSSDHVDRQASLTYNADLRRINLAQAAAWPSETAEHHRSYLHPTYENQYHPANSLLDGNLDPPEQEVSYNWGQNVLN